MMQLSALPGESVRRSTLDLMRPRRSNMVPDKGMPSGCRGSELLKEPSMLDGPRQIALAHCCHLDGGSP